jgi:diguanylate cyclase (GGDEF)-like protein
LFPDTELQEARVAAERMRIVVSETTVNLSGKALPRVTISIGIAQLREKQEPSALLKNADAAMYRAKQTGRNRVVLSEA